MKIVIRAGGVGTRLWPKSREARPKQLQALISNKTMLRETVDRVLPICEPEEIFISTNQKFIDEVVGELPDIPLKNIISEPERKDTAPACGLESIFIEKRFPNSIVASLGSDHLIKYPKKFHEVLKIAGKAVQNHPDYLFCLGVNPTFPSTGYGYIKLGEIIDEINHKEVYQVEKFTEKPEVKTAKKFLSKGDYLWNANMFLWNTKTLLSLYKKFLPKMYKGLVKIKDALETKNEQEVLEFEYKKFEKIAIDYAIIEKAPKIAVISVNCGWSDIGDFAVLKDELTDSEKENLVQGEHLGIDTENSLIYGRPGKIIATLGLEDMIIIDTEDALLVCKKHRAQEVKKIVEKLKEEKKEKYL
ncbi:MAG: sugar phosphate nucleotidyltransferase [Patescibacteria group bacterium]